MAKGKKSSVSKGGAAFAPQKMADLPLPSSSSKPAVPILPTIIATIIAIITYRMYTLFAVTAEIGASVCGDGKVTGFEECDTGVFDQPGCNDDCTIQQFFRCDNAVSPSHCYRPKQFDRVDSITYQELVDKYWSKGEPVIITGMLKEWPAMQKWNLDYLLTSFGDIDVEVQMGRESDASYEVNSPKHKEKLPFGKYLDMIRKSNVTNDFYMTANNQVRRRFTDTSLCLCFVCSRVCCLFVRLILGRRT
jgi:hypothetical protein